MSVSLLRLRQGDTDKGNGMPWPRVQASCVLAKGGVPLRCSKSFALKLLPPPRLSMAMRSGLPILSADYLARIEKPGRAPRNARAAGSKGHVNDAPGRSEQVRSTESKSESARIRKQEGATFEVDGRESRRWKMRLAAGDLPVIGPPSSSSSSSFSQQASPHDIRNERVDPPSLRTPMAVKTHSWVSLWFLVTAPVVAWDIGYCFMRHAPRSMIGGDLHWIWKPYALYQNVSCPLLPELQPSPSSRSTSSTAWLPWNAGMGSPMPKVSQQPRARVHTSNVCHPALLNVVETIMNVVYLYTAHVAGWPPAPMIGFAAATMTLSKTVLYWAQEYYCNYCAVGHNSINDLILLWIIPNGLWIVVPAFIVWRLGKDIAGQLTLAHNVAVKSASGKNK
ncbi:unnamed protein product [Mycena citricolor]|uniref:Uncharacterized protein n=1 Tax=Mycena citricolor TaxID=2018698 RepID=A0AAD2HF99_9AGAR|nr:unnamed protein product [Mycena citricolor]